MRVGRAELADRSALMSARALLHEHPRKVTIPECAIVSGQSVSRLYDRFANNGELCHRLIDHELLSIMEELPTGVVAAFAPDTHTLSRAWAVRLATKDQRRAIVAAAVETGRLDRVTAWSIFGMLEWACEDRPNKFELRQRLRFIIAALASLSFRSREETNPGLSIKR